MFVGSTAETKQMVIRASEADVYLTLATVQFC